MNLNQKTISKKISFSGIGLHSGKSVTINLLPSKENSGINFISGNQQIEASWQHGFYSQLCTKIGKKNNFISTIEHLMFSLSSLGISNLKIETTSGEIPILDGSAKNFIDEISELGLLDQNINQNILLIKKKILLREGNKFIKIEPNNEKNLVIDYTIDYDDELIKKQSYIYKHCNNNYKKIYRARTFCLHDDLEKIFSMGLAKGGSLDNAIVVSGNKILNQGGLRYENEFVKHKILDCVGDLYLAQLQIFGKVTVYSGGHEMNLKILQEVFRDKQNYEIIKNY